MKLYAPKYYKKFKCIADKCPHSCCIGWEIDVDENTLEKYKRLKNGYGTVIAESISTDDAPHFKLLQNDRCPHLDKNGLCKIILNAGEDYLCDICREHPRFYNYTSVAEVGLGMSCAEAARIILSSPDYAELDEIGDASVEADGVLFDGRAKRGEIYAILTDTSCDYRGKLDKIYRKYLIDEGEDSSWLEILNRCEYLDLEHKKLFMNYSSARRPIGKDEYLERFLAYFIYRHCTEALDADDFCARLSFCLFCERLFASLICHTGADSLVELASLASIISEELEYSDENTLALTYQ
jgi:lysine-N-methylase